jgi:hypothetical protein
MHEMPKPQAQHEWLSKLVGEWTYEHECSMGPDSPPMKSTGLERVRSLGGLWTIGEGEGEMPGGEVGHVVMTLGYDPAKERFVGTFIGSMMTYMWVYEGTLDPTGKILTLDTVGPNMTGQGMAKYQDIMEFKDDNYRTLSSQFQGEDGKYHGFMVGHYRRKQ